VTSSGFIEMGAGRDPSFESKQASTIGIVTTLPGRLVVMFVLSVFDSFARTLATQFCS
jgi:hypothetical protein